MNVHSSASFLLQLPAIEKQCHAPLQSWLKNMINLSPQCRTPFQKSSGFEGTVLTSMSKKKLQQKKNVLHLRNLGATTSRIKFPAVVSTPGNLEAETWPGPTAMDLVDLGDPGCKHFVFGSIRPSDRGARRCGHASLITCQHFGRVSVACVAVWVRQKPRKDVLDNWTNS